MATPDLIPDRLVTLDLLAQCGALEVLRGHMLAEDPHAPIDLGQIPLPYDRGPYTRDELSYVWDRARVHINTLSKAMGWNLPLPLSADDVTTSRDTI